MIKRIDNNEFLKGLRERVIEGGIAEREEGLKVCRTSYMDLLVKKARLRGFRNYLRRGCSLKKERVEPFIKTVLNFRPRTVVLTGPPGAGKTFTAYYLVLSLLGEGYRLDDRKFWAFCTAEGELFGQFRNEDVLMFLTRAYRKIPVLVVDGINPYSLTREREEFYRYLISERAGMEVDNFYLFGLTIITVNGLMEPTFLDGIKYKLLDLKHFSSGDDYKPALDDFELNSELYPIY